MNFSIKYSFDIETKQYIAEIPELGLSDFWDSIDEAEKNIKITLALYIEEITKNSKNISKKLEYA